MDDSAHGFRWMESGDLSSTYQADEPTPGSPTLAIAKYVPDRSFHHDELDGENGQLVVQDCGYQSSASSTQHSSDILSGIPDEGDLAGGVHSRASSRSSISSLPASVFTQPPDRMKPFNRDATHDQIALHPWDDEFNHSSYDKMDSPFKNINAIRRRETAFRKPSSVRAMQMHTEDEGDDDFLTPPKRRGGARLSDISMRSAGSSPIKRSPYYSPSGSASKPKPKKEYPLVLLHCTLLPPSLPIPGSTDKPDQKILREVLPGEYWRRWKLLQEKVGSGVLRDRGVLISHPEDMYDLLEDRLLESLELQRPRLDHGHFLGRDETESEEEEDTLHGEEESATDDEQGEPCPDCGGRVVRHRDTGRKWEIKVFAANGLMRAGAWAAAWREMEKVDVEVGLWLPSEVRRELEKRLLENEIYQMENRLPIPQLRGPLSESEPTFEHEPISTVHHEPRPMSLDTEKRRSPNLDSETPPDRRPSPSDHISSQYYCTPPADIDLNTLLVNYVRVLASDPRNVVLAFLAILVAFLVTGSRSGVDSTSTGLRQSGSDMVNYHSMQTVSLEQYSSVASADSAYPFESPGMEDLDGSELELHTSVPLSPTSVSRKEYQNSYQVESQNDSQTDFQTDYRNDSPNDSQVESQNDFPARAATSIAADMTPLRSTPESVVESDLESEPETDLPLTEERADTYAPPNPLTESKDPARTVTDAAVKTAEVVELMDLELAAAAVYAQCPVFYN
ncbi:hypothetical protein P168DRAFT_287195 [Aspergillus campestris IBT 28561]|uniref:Flavoprotein oxygenase n=1 Tax=Aspergillus campestris (strain IBT 28561) TaxID=1392248 RepID=A0A2I1DGX5_ASPC2|nr:uncharacterized protein P168DRAFT_287195 [Aspergillus campestris IBT 28561]PKY09123.1 hypothetical protein P168DRAFT_287195 [Aspergillus campestris IBT 28561]